MEIPTVTLVGKECQCMRCGEVFTTESTYDRHERFPPEPCMNVRTAVHGPDAKHAGQPLFEAITRRGITVWKMWSSDEEKAAQAERYARLKEAAGDSAA